MQELILEAQNIMERVLKSYLFIYLFIFSVLQKTKIKRIECNTAILS